MDRSYPEQEPLIGFEFKFDKITCNFISKQQFFSQQILHVILFVFGQNWFSLSTWVWRFFYHANYIASRTNKKVTNKTSDQ